jgi:hypothetical protein
MDPLVARGFAALGIDKRALIEWCAENARLPAREYWDDQSIQSVIRPRAVAGIEPYASRLKAAPDELIRIFTPNEVKIVVGRRNAGGVQDIRPECTWRPGALTQRAIRIEVALSAPPIDTIFSWYRVARFRISRLSLRGQWRQSHLNTVTKGIRRKSSLVESARGTNASSLIRSQGSLWILEESRGLMPFAPVDYGTAELQATQGIEYADSSGSFALRLSVRAVSVYSRRQQSCGPGSARRGCSR